jgi:hypothetical protein
MDFVDHHQLARLRSQIRVGIVESAQVGLALKVEVDRRNTTLVGDAACERRLPDLARSQQYYGRRSPKRWRATGSTERGIIFIPENIHQMLEFRQ